MVESKTDDCDIGVNDPRLPVTVIAGFLGAGKTTWLNQRIAEGLVNDALIIVNDVGAVNVDVESIAYRDDRVLALTNGCMCCTLGGTLIEQLSQALRLKSRPSQIIIEASGVADPARIADVARLAPGMRLAEVVVLVDARQARYLATDMQVGQMWRAQLAAAKRILVNRLPPEPARGELLQWLRGQASATVLECMSETGEITKATGSVESVVEPPFLASPSQPSNSRVPSAGHGAAHGLSHCTVRFAAPVDLGELEAILYQHLDVVLRAKGFVSCRSADGERWVSLQLSGRQLESRAHAPATNGSLLVCIGRGGSRFDHLIQCLQALGSPVRLSAEPHS